MKQVPEETLRQVRGAFDVCLLALAEASPCMWEDCQQVQIESNRAAEKLALAANKAIQAILDEPSEPKPKRKNCERCSQT